ncbi:MAG: TonB-dependent receptor domain-containing protein [Methylobacter sp.]
MISTTLIESAEATVSCGIAVGKFVSIEGAIELEHAAQGERQPATLESTLCQNDMIHVGENSRAAVSLINDVMLRLDQNTTMRLVDVAPQPEKRSMLELVVGAFKSFSRPPRTFAVNTPYINGLIEGTEFAMRVEGDSSMVTVYEGKVATTNEKGKLTLKRGESALAKKGQAPQPYLMVKPWDAVQWTLHFPPLLAALGGGAQQIPPDTSPVVKEAFSLVSRGDTPGALKLLEGVPASERNAAYHLYRAALFLDVGRVDQARSDIDSSLTINPKAGLAYALRAIIELARNERPQAIASAEKAVALAPSAAAKIALSYAQQSDFRLEAARETLLSAVREYPNDPLAWARLAEVWLMFANRGKALEAAHKAEALAPGLAKTQTVLGFAALAENRETESETAFERAISLASDDPLAHFGLGLSKIKRGNLAEGRKELEAAVALDSSNALLRSYLGKAYYEEKRSPLEGQQFDIAKELDPADPTPYLYSAIDKQTTNRPVEALQDMQKAIELNDNRAVYRSRQLLDSDLAARSASQARIYSDLGFQQRALVEGWKSVNTDSSNFSAHRFLADSYSALPRHEIARVSELLQSQLLQPLNMTPIQPRLAESNLFLISAGGPGAMSFNEFNPIFNRDGLTFQMNGLAGENSTNTGEGIVAGIYEKFAFSFGYNHFESDGWRTNADQNDDLANAFFQLELSPQTSIQTEYRYRNRNNGDLELRFFPDDFRRNYQEEEERNSIRVGLHHAFAPNSDFLGSFMYQHRNTSAQDRPDSFVSSIDEQFPDQQAFSGEVQHLFRSRFVNLTSGLGYFDINANRKQTIEFDPAYGFPPLQSKTDEDTQHLNLYLYSYLNLLKNVTFTLGGSGDLYDTASAATNSRDQFNPKFGVSWNILPNTTLRAAAFRAMKRTLITDQTLEPTQIAGFNQFYDDINTTDSWRYGSAIDQKFSSTVFGGVEFSKRDVNIPFETIDAVTGESQINRDDGEEYLGRSYLVWTPLQWLALNSEYQYEQFKNDTGIAVNYEELTTNRVALGLNLFHHSGLSASLKGTYFDQNGEFIRRNLGVCCEHGEDNFWVVDATVSYRLPKRYGFIKIGATNLLDQQFDYFDTNRGSANRNPLIIPDRVFFGSLTLAFP